MMEREEKLRKIREFLKKYHTPPKPPKLICPVCRSEIKLSEMALAVLELYPADLPFECKNCGCRISITFPIEE